MDEKNNDGNKMSRREYLKTSVMGTAGLFFAPSVVPASVLGSNPPSEKIQIGQIGCGRIARGHDLRETMGYDSARVIAVCDVDIRRARDAKNLVEGVYSKQQGSDNYMDVKVYKDYREMLQNSEIDAVIISTPDHWHAQPAIRAAMEGKDIYLQKPASLTIEEGRAMSDIINRTGTVFQIGSQQRSVNPWPQFKRACELVRNGRIGELEKVEVGLPGDPGGGDPTPMDVPETLDYDMWLGSTPDVPYTVQRVHPVEGYSRPGWLRCRQFSAGMITGWGAHHIDTAHWGMGTEFTGPVEIEAEAEFPTDDPSYKGLWNVHGNFKVNAKYENGVIMTVGGDNQQGVKFIGSEGWIYVSRGDVGVTDSDPASAQKPTESFNASDPKILTSEIGENEIHLYESEEQHGNWLRCIKTRELTVAPAEVAHRSCSACLISHIVMQLPRKLYWDPLNERFKNDDEANSMLSRSQRSPWGIKYIDGLEI
jgi:predicted dehydrogenase